MRWAWSLVAAAACAHAQANAPVAAVPPRPDLVAPAVEVPAVPIVPPATSHAQARERMRAHDWEAAQEMLDAVLAAEPNDAAALFEAGYVAEQLAGVREALALYRRALQVDPASMGAALNAARLLDPAAAESVLRAALEKHPGEPRLLDALAGVLRAAKKLDEAEATAQKVLERHPRDAGAWRVLAMVEADRGRVRLAESALNNARKLDGRDAAIVNELGLLAVRRQDVVAARSLFEEAVRIDPAFAPGWANLGALALRYRDYAAAERALSKAAELAPGRAETHLARGWALEGLRKPREARAEYELVLAANPADDDALFGRALALKAEGDLPGASAALRQYLERKDAAHSKEARQHLAGIALRLHSAATAPPATAAAEVDVSKLPQTQPPAAEHVR